MSNSIRTTEARLPASGIRAFVALRLGDDIESAIAGFVGEIALGIHGVSWVAKSKLHVTLRFLGDRVSSERISAVAEAVRALTSDFAPFALDVRGVGAFPNLRRPRVLWVGLAGAPLVELGRRVEHAIVAAGFDPEPHPFSPHLTIARVRAPDRFGVDAARILQSFADRMFGRCEIRELLLFRSLRSREGSDYEQLGRFPLRSSPAD